MLSPCPAPTVPNRHPGERLVELRVSQRRVGSNPENEALVGPVVAENQPSTSTATFTEPTLFAIVTVQSVPLQVTGTITRFGTTWCAFRLTLDAFGAEVPPAYALTNVWAVGAMAVRLKTTALTLAPGTGLLPPPTLKVSGAPAPPGGAQAPLG